MTSIHSLLCSYSLWHYVPNSLQCLVATVGIPIAIASTSLNPQYPYSTEFGVIPLCVHSYRNPQYSNLGSYLP